MSNKRQNVSVSRFLVLVMIAALLIPVMSGCTLFPSNKEDQPSPVTTEPSVSEIDEENGYTVKVFQSDLEKNVILNITDKNVAFPEDVSIADQYTDNVCNYYLLKLGHLENVPMLWSGKYHHQIKEAEMTKEFSLTATDSRTVSDTVSRSVTETKGWELGVSGGIRIGRDSSKVAGNISGFYNHSESTALSEQFVHTVAHSVSEEMARTYRFSISKDCPLGYYRYTVFAEYVDVYVLLVYSLDDQYLYYDYLSLMRNDYEYGYVDTIEYSEDGSFTEYQGTLVFDDSCLDLIDFSSPLEFRGEEMIPEIIIQENHTYLNDEEYRLEYADNNNSNARCHDYFTVGNLVMTGCREEGEKYIISSNSAKEFSVRFHLIVDPENLPSPKHTTKISIDTCTKFLGKEVGRIGQGIYWVIVTFNDGSEQKEIIKTNFLGTKQKGSYITILSKKDFNAFGEDRLSKIASIDIKIGYEVFIDTGFFVTYQHNRFISQYHFSFITVK